MLVRAFEIHDRVGAAVDLALYACETGEVRRVFEDEGVRRSGIEPDIQDVVNLLPAVVAELAEEALARARGVPGVRPLVLESLDDADIDFGILQDIDRTVGLFRRLPISAARRTAATKR